MALNHRLTIEGSNIEGQNLEIKVYLEGYAGAPVTRYGVDDTMQIEWGTSDNKTLPLIYGSELTARFKADNDYEFLDLFTSTIRDTYVEAYIDEALAWAGFIEPRKWSEPLISAPYEVTFTAYDGLGLLKDEDFRNADKSEITGEKTPIEILTILLGKTGLQLPFNTAVNIRPSGASTAADALTQYKIDVAIYNEKTCYEIFEQLFKGCRIWQRNGQWWIIANNLLKAAAINIYTYTSAGVANGTGSVNTHISDYKIEDSLNLELVSGLKQWKIKQDFGYIANLLTNPDFSDFNSGIFDSWTNYNVAPEQRTLNADGDKFVYIPGREKVSAWRTDVRTKYMLSDNIPVAAASDLFNVKISYAIMGNNGEAAGVFVGIRLIGNSGTEYALSPYIDTTDGHRLAFRWEETTGVYNIPMKAYMKHAENWFFSDDYYVQYESIQAHPFDEIANNFQTESISTTNGLPEGGNIRIYLFAADSSRSGIAGACFSKIEMFLTDEEGDEFATGKNIILINDLNNNYTPEDLEIINGDTPNVGNQLAIYNGQFIKTADNTATNLWAADGITGTYTYVELIARLLAAEIRTTKQAVSGMLAEIALNFTFVFEDTANNNSGKHFIETGIKYNFRMASIDGSFSELITPNLSTFTIVEEITTTTTNETKTNNKTPATLATDEKVKLINPQTYDLLGQPGYLSVEYFDQVIDTITGRAAIYPYNVKINTDNFNGIFSPAENTLQKALDLLDNWNPLPTGGTHGQVLKKNSSNNYDVIWSDESGGGTIITGNASLTETPAGLINGVNTVYTLSQEPAAGTVRVYLNGVRQRPGTDYTVTGQNITFTVAPFSGDSIIVDYNANEVTTVYNETPAGLINGENTVYTLSQTPATVKIYLNGVRQRPGIDYSVTDDTITFTNAPFSGDYIIVDYEI